MQVRTWGAEGWICPPGKHLLDSDEGEGLVKEGRAQPGGEAPRGKGDPPRNVRGTSVWEVGTQIGTGGLCPV